jgi:putative addiction module component (TIGR02574 family)
MPLTIEQIKAEAMKLPPEARADLADWLWISVESRESVQAAWDAEIARRIEEIESGKVELIPGEEVLARIDKKLRESDA